MIVFCQRIFGPTDDDVQDSPFEIVEKDGGWWWVSLTHQHHEHAHELMGPFATAGDAFNDVINQPIG